MSDTSRFSARPFLRNPHLQSVLNSQGPRKWRARRILTQLESESLILPAEDGTRLLAEFDRGEVSGHSALVVMLHGWEGSSRSAYMMTTTRYLLEQGFDVLRVNLRDHGDSHHLNRELFNSTRSPEVASAVRGYVDARDYARVFLLGFSLGGSFALRIAADEGQRLGLAACVAVCPPADPARVMDALNDGFFAYERYFFRRWSASLWRKLELFPDLGYGEDLALARSLDDLNEFFIPRHTPYRRTEDYFAAYALVGDRLAALAVPTHLIASRDDPIIPVSDLERIDANEHLQMEISRHGGHCGFIEDFTARSWVERRVLRIFSDYL